MTRLDLALAHVAAGRAVYPVRAGVPRGAASLDAARVRAWWAAHPRDGVAVVLPDVPALMERPGVLTRRPLVALGARVVAEVCGDPVLT